jgi:hypothetical protein
MGAFKSWTKEEIDYLQTNYLTMNNTDIGQAIGKTNLQVINKLTKFGLKRPGTLGYKLAITPEGCSKRSERMKQLYKDGKVNITWAGKPRPDSVKQAVSKANKGKTWDILFGLDKASEMRAKLKERCSLPTNIFKNLDDPRVHARKHTEEEKRKIGEGNKRRIWSLDSKKKASETKKRLFAEGKIIPWSKGKRLEYMEGEKNPLWNNGSSFDPYTPDFNKRFKEAIKERDSSCVLCNISLEDLAELKREVQIHHIDYNKLNSFPQNCVALCIKCHGLTIINREHWVKFFQDLLRERYGYKYTEDQKILFDFMGDK